MGDDECPTVLLPAGPGYDHGGEAKMASTPTRAARLLAFAGDVVAVAVILDTLVRLSRGELMPARSAETAADRLRADPALSGRPARLPAAAGFGSPRPLLAIPSS